MLLRRERDELVEAAPAMLKSAKELLDVLHLLRGHGLAKDADVSPLVKRRLGLARSCLATAEAIAKHAAPGKRQ